MLNLQQPHPDDPPDHMATQAEADREFVQNVAHDIGAVVVIGLVFAICLQANGQEAPKPADSIVNPDIILRSTPQKLSPMQKAYEKLLLREMYERDKQDPRRVTVCI